MPRGESSDDAESEEEELVANYTDEESNGSYSSIEDNGHSSSIRPNRKYHEKKQPISMMLSPPMMVPTQQQHAPPVLRPSSFGQPNKTSRTGSCEGLDDSAHSTLSRLLSRGSLDTLDAMTMENEQALVMYEPAEDDEDFVNTDDDYVVDVITQKQLVQHFCDQHRQAQAQQPPTQNSKYPPPPRNKPSTTVGT